MLQDAQCFVDVGAASISCVSVAFGFGSYVYTRQLRLGLTFPYIYFILVLRAMSEVVPTTAASPTAVVGCAAIFSQTACLVVSRWFQGGFMGGFKPPEAIVTRSGNELEMSSSQAPLRRPAPPLQAPLRRSGPPRPPAAPSLPKPPVRRPP